MRRSIFGYFCRRCFVSFVKLSFSGVIKLQRDFQAWIDGDLTAGYQVVNKEQLTNGKLIHIWFIIIDYHIRCQTQFYSELKQTRNLGPNQNRLKRGSFILSEHINLLG